MNRSPLDPCVVIIFGGTGDLSRRKLLPALFRLSTEGRLHANTLVLGVALSAHDDASFQQVAIDALVAAKIDEAEATAFARARVRYHTISRDAPDFAALGAHIRELEAGSGLPGNRAFYLALPPRVFASTIDGLGAVGLNRSAGWTRVVVEKPFGKDLASARKLNAHVHEVYDESQIYRIDHYLGKETVQNLMVLRFANTIFESMWNRDRIEAIQITVAESLGVGTRAGYYDQSGALRDMIQNHLTQLLTLVAMEVPSAYEADAIRYEKIKVLRSLRPLTQDDVVLGQYRAGEIDGEPVPGYLEADGVAPDSTTETFVGMRVFVDNWRWQGVPFYLRTGKRLEKKLSTITVQFRHTPVSLFDNFGRGNEPDQEAPPRETADVLVITLQPHEGFSLHFDVKKPGGVFATQRIPLHFRYDELFEGIPAAYQTLLLDMLEGDQTLFVHADEVEQSWAFYAPLFESHPGVVGYDAGGWGPPEADRFALACDHLWKDRWDNKEPT